jgi:predicted secreted protein
MRISVQADEGDEVSICADFISVEQAIVTLEIENTLYNSQTELDSVTLSIDKARELAHALLSVVSAIETVKVPTNFMDSTANFSAVLSTALPLRRIPDNKSGNQSCCRSSRHGTKW